MSWARTPLYRHIGDLAGVVPRSRCGRPKDDAEELRVTLRDPPGYAGKREEHQQSSEQAVEERERRAPDHEGDEEQAPVGAANRQRPIDRRVDGLQTRRRHGLRETATP